MTICFGNARKIEWPPNSAQSHGMKVWWIMASSCACQVSRLTDVFPVTVSSTIIRLDLPSPTGPVAQLRVHCGTGDSKADTLSLACSSLEGLFVSLYYTMVLSGSSRGFATVS